MTGLNQRRCTDDGEKQRPPEQAACMCTRGGFRRHIQRCKTEAHERAQESHGNDRPDQLSGIDHRQQCSGDKRADDESGRTPEPHRPVVQAVAHYALECITIDQRRQWRPRTSHQAEYDQDRERIMQQPDRHEPESGDEGQHHHGLAQNLPAFGKGCHERLNGEPAESGDRRDNPDPRNIDADGFQPDWKERQIRAAHAQR